MVPFKVRLWIPLVLTVGMCPTFLSALDCDLSQYRGQEGLTATRQGDALAVLWAGDNGSSLRMLLAVDSGVPTIRQLDVRSRSTSWATLGRNLTAEISMTSGRRRAGHGLPDKQRWDVYWDAPLVIPGVQTPYGNNPDLPRKPEEIRRATATYHATSCAVKTDGGRLEVSFPGLEMGIFSGRLQLTVYKGANLMRLEAIAKTEEPSVAYIYRGGLKGFNTKDLEKLTWRDTGGDTQKYEFGGAPNDSEVPVVVKNRVLIGEGKSGSIATFPPPHQFFFPRQIEVNLGYVWYRKDNDSSFAFGVRQSETAGNYAYPLQVAGSNAAVGGPPAAWSKTVWPLYNAPPGTWQRMAIYFYISPQGADACRAAVMAFTHGDQYKLLPGYKTMIGHLHTATTADVKAAGSLDMQPTWLAPMRALGINIFENAEFHGDGHPKDPGQVRLKELEDYYYVARRNSDRDFLLLPGEQLSSDTYLGGAYEVLFNKPVYWTIKREPGHKFIEQDPKYGTVYHVSNPEDMWDMIKRENALMIYSDPRTKLAAEWWVDGEAPDYPDFVKDTEWFRSDHYLGAGYNNIPTDLSQKRICEKRCFDALDDMNNWGGPKYLVAEPDTYKKFTGYELYGEFTVNYVQLDRTPSVEDWTPLVRALSAGKFFVTTGEVLIKNFRIEGTEAVSAEVEWTFPLEFVEVVWGDGKKTERKVVTVTDKPAFGNETFRIPVDLKGKKWVRFAAWDSAVNGAFTMPVHFAR